MDVPPCITTHFCTLTLLSRQLQQHNNYNTPCAHPSVYFLRPDVQSHSGGSSSPKDVPRSKPKSAPRVTAEMCFVSNSMAPFCRGPLPAAAAAAFSLMPLSSMSPVAAVRAAAGQLHGSGGGALPNHPRWGALHGRRPGSLPDLRSGGELWEPERLPVRQPHRLQWFHNQVSRCVNILAPVLCVCVRLCVYVWVFQFGGLLKKKCWFYFTHLGVKNAFSDFDFLI